MVASQSISKLKLFDEGGRGVKTAPFFFVALKRTNFDGLRYAC